jgi:O-succinylhomoserine sulfhydrylase
MKHGGGIVTFVVKGGVERGRKFLDSLEMFSHTANLGDARTIATHPASTTHSKIAPEVREAVGIYDGMVRVSVGLEHINDIIADIEQALARSK